MLIAMLKGRTRSAEAKPPRASTRSSTMVSFDISGPLPPTPATAVAPRTESRAPASRASEPMRQVNELSSLPPEIDPFEADFPWIGWVEPRHESFVRSDRRSRTFEQDLQRVLSIFAN